jgi:photosystem II stability/assembly factor-like uncharacterized protein
MKKTLNHFIFTILSIFVLSIYLSDATFAKIINGKDDLYLDSINKKESDDFFALKGNSIENSTESYIVYDKEVRIYRNRDFQINSLNAISKNNNIYVAVGSNSLILTSSDKKNWTKHFLNIDCNLYDIVWNGKIFVAVGSDSTLVTSKDGITWNIIMHHKGKKALNVVTWNGSKFVAGGKSSSFVSSDGVNWTLTPLFGVKDIIYDGNKFVAIGRNRDNNETIILTSTNGDSWNKKIPEIQYISKKRNSFSKWHISNIAFNGKTYIAAGYENETYLSEDCEHWIQINADDVCLSDIVWTGSEFLSIGGNYKYISKDGLTWQKYSFNKNDKESQKYDYTSKLVSKDNELSFFFDSIDNQLLNIYHYEDEFLTLGKNETILSSKDGVNWNCLHSKKEDNPTIYDIAFNGHIYVAVGDTGCLYMSNNGINWSKLKLKNNSKMKNILWTGQNFLATSSSANYVITSVDGINWSENENSNEPSISSMIWTGKNFIALGKYHYADPTTIFTSSCGVKWNKEKELCDFEGNSIAYNDKKIIIVGNNGKIFTSEKEGIWKEVNSGTDDNLNNIIWNGEKFVVVGSGKEILYSEDGDTWIKVKCDYRNLNNIYWHDNKFTAVGSAVLESPDGINWIKLDHVPPVNILCGVFDKNKYVMVGENGNFITYTGDNDYAHISKNIYSWKRDLNIASVDLYDAAYNGKVYCAVGNDGIIFTSKDSLKWSKQKTCFDGYLNAIVWFKDKFIAVGDEGTILTSVDGVTWNREKSNTTYMLNDIELCGDKVIAIGFGGTILKSSDGISWNHILGLTDDYLSTITWNGKEILIVGSYTSVSVSYGFVLKSTDGDNWTIYRKDKTNIPDNTLDTICNEKVYISVGRNGIFKSSDGVKWEQANIQLRDFKAVATDGNKFVAVGNTTDSYKNISMISTDGINWSEAIVDNVAFTNVMWDGNQFIATAYGGKILSSKDGLKWNKINDECNISLKGIASKNNSLVAVGYKGILISKDGLTWTENKSLSTEKLDGLDDISWGIDKFVSIGMANNIVISENGIDWTKLKGRENTKLDDYSNYNCIATNGVIFIIGTHAGEIYSSKDGITWTSSYKNKKSHSINDIVWDGQQFCAVTEWGILLTSKDGIHWSEKLLNTNSIIYGLYKYKNTTLLLGEDIILSSKNGEKWESCHVDNIKIRSAAFNGEYYIAVGDEGTVLISKNGVDWKRENVGTKNNLFKIIWNGKKFIIVGDRATILYST